MTIIAAASWKGETWIASDSAGTDGWGLQTAHGTKLSRFPFGVVGFTASYRTLQAIHSELWKVQRVETDEQARALVDVISKGLTDAGWSRSTTGALPSCSDLTFLIATKGGRLYVIHSDLAILRYEKFAAVGSGYHVAMGAMHATQTLPVRKALRGAMRAACCLVSTCGGRIFMEKVR